MVAVFRAKWTPTTRVDLTAPFKVAGFGGTLGAAANGVSVRTERGSRESRRRRRTRHRQALRVRGFSRPPGAMVGFKLHLEATAAARRLAGIVQLVSFVAATSAPA